MSYLVQLARIYLLSIRQLIRCLTETKTSQTGRLQHFSRLMLMLL